MEVLKEVTQKVMKQKQNEKEEVWEKHRIEETPAEQKLQQEEIFGN